jgi:hypothetical protein
MQKLMRIALLGMAWLCGGCAGIATMPLSSASSVLSSPKASNLEIHTGTQVTLSGANFMVVKTNVVGQSKGFALLGIVTIVPARFQTAMNRLYADAQMQPGKPQTMGNVVMEKSSTFLILFSIPRVSVRADVLEFVPPPP